MREILFRGIWVHGNKEWIEGDLVRDSEGKPHIVDTKYAVYWGGESIFVCEDECEVIPETVGQYTGLTDKNGKKIFEGDIISTDIKRPYLIVEFRDGCFMFNCNDGGEDYYDIMLPICKEAHTEYEYGEIIGNIHDNPELLEVK